jgi:hypothetical protein
MSQNANELFQSALDDGSISMNSFDILNVNDIGSMIQGNLGISADQFEESEAFLVSILVDDSGSIRFSGNSQAVRDGYNVVIESLKSSKQCGSILVHTEYLNGFVLNPYNPIAGVVKMDSGNYDPSGRTPLYDKTVTFLASVLAKTQELKNEGIAVRTATLIMTDGADEHSTRHGDKEVKQLISDMLKEEIHIVAAMGIDNKSTDFKHIFKEMGIRDEWVLTPGDNESDIRKAFGAFSQSVVRASQCAGSFSQTAMGGFGN